MFQSAPSRGATTQSFPIPRRCEFQSAPPSRGATPGGECLAAQSVVSIRAPLAGSDRYAVAQAQFAPGFNPRPPRGERPIALLNGDA